MHNRREFLKRAGLLSGAAAMSGVLPEAIRKAFAIDPEPGSTFQDAEHIVILMQENRSFDHAYGTLQGVRGFNDPRAIRQPNDHLVWLQTNAKGETYAPFRFDIKESRATWMGSLPHTWPNQVDARNGGKHDRWLQAKPSGRKAFAEMPLTLGHYTRDDIPFYYALADAFTICDQHFCSSLTGTMPNRLYFWSGTIRGAAGAPAKVLNENIEYEDSANWTTFPERLEDHGVSWKIYQNELYLDVGLTRAQWQWLSNFGDNPLEYFTQYHARFLPAYREELARKLATLPGEIETLRARLQRVDPAGPDYPKIQGRLQSAEESLKHAKKQSAKYTEENFAKLSPREKSIFTKAFSTNKGDPHYHEIVTLRYQDGAKTRRMNIPKGDVLHEFRRDVESGSLPAVSWIVAPENFSDHPTSAWFGSWYLSEVFDILTRNPTVWQKTIFLLTYDENDGYFDHVPPFVAPHPHKATTGIVSKGIEPIEDFVTLEEELKKKPASEARENSIGLGYRVPLVVASPWSRGGYVCSQVFDHTSVLQLLEKFASKKAGRKVQETNISPWRRAVCGDLTSAFRPYHGEKISLPTPVAKRPFIEQINKARFKKLPTGLKPLEPAEIEQLNRDPRSAPYMSAQEPGTRPSCALPYELRAEGRFDPDGKAFEIAFGAGNAIFGARAAGSPFNVYAPGKYLAAIHGGGSEKQWEICRNWAFAVAPGAEVRYSWPLADFEGETYHLRVHGPNGFFRDFEGPAAGHPLEVRFEQLTTERRPTMATNVTLHNFAKMPVQLEIEDRAYKTGKRTAVLNRNENKTIVIDFRGSSGWYDFTVAVPGISFSWRFAGRLETGRTSVSDPAMG